MIPTNNVYFFDGHGTGLHINDPEHSKEAAYCMWK